MSSFDSIKGRWQHRKTGKIVEVVSMNTRDDSLGLIHESGRHSSRKIHYFKEEYERPATTMSTDKATSAARLYPSSDGRKWSDERMSDTDAEYVLADYFDEVVAALTQISDKGCRVIHANYPRGTTCADMQDLARINRTPYRFEATFRAEILADGHLCDGCVARKALAAVADSEDQAKHVIEPLVSTELEPIMEVLREVYEHSDHTKTCPASNIAQLARGEAECDCWVSRAQKLIDEEK